MALKVSAVIRLLMHFIAWPAPRPPRWNTARPITSSSGRTRARSAAAPPTMNTRLASAAPQAAPDTGASTIAAPCAARAAAVASVSQGSADEQSSSSAPGRSPCTRPASPSATCCTTPPCGSMVMMMSLCAATSAGVAASRAPAPRRAATWRATAASASSSVSRWPAAARWPAMGAPITPRPMNPRLSDVDVVIRAPGVGRLRSRKRAQGTGAVRVAGMTAAPPGGGDPRQLSQTAARPRTRS